jgi:hypothetical protein
MGALPNLYGLRADGIRNFEVSEPGLIPSPFDTLTWECPQVLLADGRLVNANVNENADLHRTLKGGGSNFGTWQFHYCAWFGGYG